MNPYPNNLIDHFYIKICSVESLEFRSSGSIEIIQTRYKLFFLREITLIKFFIALRLEVNGEKIEIRGYRKNTQYNELCQKMLTMQPCEIPVKLYKEKYFFD